MLTMRASMLSALLIRLVAVGAVASLVGIPFFFQEKLISTLSAILVLGSFAVCWALIQNRRVVLGGWLLLASTFAFSSVMVFTSGGLRSADILFFISGAVLAGLVSGSRGASLYGLASLAICLGSLLQETAGVQPQDFSYRPWTNWILLATNLILTVFTLSLALEHLQAALKRLREELVERKQIEAHLQVSQARYRDFVEQSIDGIWMLAFDQPIPTDLPAEEQVRRMQYTSQIAECNDAIARMYGYASSREFVGTRLLDLYGGAPSAVNTRSALKLVQDGYRSGNRETEEFDRSGKPVYFLNNAVGVIRDGSLVALWGTQRDITSQKQAELALMASEARLRALLEAVPDLIFEIDRQGRILEYVPSKEEDTYLPPDAFLGRTLSEVLPPDVAEPAMAAIEQALARQASQKIEYQLPAPAGLGTYEARITPATPERVLVIVRDITERKQAEQEREKLIAELESKNAELERFTYTVSHDLKSPLITIRGFIGFIERDVLAGNLERARGDMARIVAATEKMHRLLNDLLELSRIGRLMNTPETLSFESVVREALELVSVAVEARQIRVEVAPDLPQISGDRVRLVEVVQNLVENAAKFMGDQADPTIWIGCAGRDAEGKAVLFVRDNGTGIAPEFHQRVFGLFNKLDPYSEGTGVGLALVKRIIEIHGGRIWVESAGGGSGTAFYFTLPGV